MYAGKVADLNDEKNETVYVCLNTSGFLGGNFPVDKEKATWIDFADYDVTKSSSDKDFYHTFFSKLAVENNKLVLTTYKNTHNESDHTITNTEVIDTCTIEK